jgi:hypothetical protein
MVAPPVARYVIQYIITRAVDAVHDSLLLMIITLKVSCCINASHLQFFSLSFTVSISRFLILSVRARVCVSVFHRPTV